MKLSIPKSKTIFFFAFILIALIASRFFNLDKTARFIWDESDDLVHMRQIYIDKKITLVGPISEDGSKVFGSLTYYMFLPFAIVGDFDPVSPAYGAAFWGIITGILLLYLIYKVNRKMIWLMIPVILFWFPLVETGRWAWNPNLIPLWVTLSIIFYLKSSGLSRFLSGLFIGLSIHHHYLAVFAAVGLGIVVLVESIRGREIKKFVAYASGLFAAIVPFIVFDLRHPPGLFITRILYFNNLGAGEGGSIFEKLVFIIKNVFSYFSGGSIVLEKILIAFTSLLIIKDIGNIKKQGAALKFIGVFVLQVIALTLVADYYGHYILPVLPFFIVYLVYPRQGIGKVLSYTAIGVILLSLIISFPKQIDKVSWETDIASTRFITNTIEEEIINGDRKNSNIAVLESDDPNTYGRRYRDLLLIKGVVLKTKGEYEISDNLFVVTKSSLEKLREDPAYEIRNFRDGPIIKTWEVPESDWKIFLFSRSI